MNKNQKLLTTEELLKALEDTSSATHITKQKKQHKKKIQWVILWGIVAIAVLHLLFFSIPAILGVHRTVQMLGQTSVIGIPFVAGDVPAREGHVMVISRYNLDEIDYGDRVIVYGLIDTDYYWEVEISNFDMASRTAYVTYDGVYSVDVSFDEIDGVYERSANTFGTLLFVATRWTGLLAATAVYASVISIYYVIFIREIKVLKGEKKHE